MIQNHSRGYDLLSEYYSLKDEKETRNKNEFNEISLTHQNQELNNFLKGGIRQGFTYFFYGDSLSGKTFFIETLIAKNFDKLLFKKSSKILLIDTNEGSSYRKIFQKLKIEKKKFDISYIDILRLRSDKEILNFLNLLNANKDFLYSFIFIDNFNQSFVLNSKEINQLSVIAESLAKNKKIGIVSIICKEWNTVIEKINTKNINEKPVCIDEKLYLMTQNYQFTFINYGLDFQIKNNSNYKQSENGFKYYVKILDNINTKVTIYIY